MKPGSLIVMLRFKRPNPLGVIIRKSSDNKDIGVFDSKSESKMFTSMRSDKPHQWWDVLYDKKIIVESETYLELVE